MNLPQLSIRGQEFAFSQHGRTWERSKDRLVREIAATSSSEAREAFFWTGGDVEKAYDLVRKMQNPEFDPMSMIDLELRRFTFDGMQDEIDSLRETVEELAEKLEHLAREVRDVRVDMDCM